MEVAVALPWNGWTYEQAKSAWTEVDKLGFDSLYVGDDLFTHHYDRNPNSHGDTTLPVFEPWTILPAIAETTTNVRLGTLVSPCGRRPPGVFAKMTSNVDIISGGRLIVGMGMGNAPDQFHSIGQPFLRNAERAEMLREELTILKSMWTQDTTNFDGKYYKMANAINSPKPVQKPYPQILMGFRKPAIRARIAAELADRVNIQGPHDSEVTQTLERLQKECSSIKRDYDSVIKSRVVVLVFTEQHVKSSQIESVLVDRARIIGWNPEEVLEKYRDRNLYYIGPPEDCAEVLSSRVLDLGFSEVIIFIDIVGHPGFDRAMHGFRVVAEKVMPELKRL